MLTLNISNCIQMYIHKEHDWNTKLIQLNSESEKIISYVMIDDNQVPESCFEIE